MLNHEPLRLADGEYRFACLVWDNEPLPSGQLVALAAEGLGWKKSTTYTVLKKLCERGVLQNARRLLRRGVRAHAVHTGFCAPARLPAGQPARPGAAGCAAA